MKRASDRMTEAVYKKSEEIMKGTGVDDAQKETGPSPDTGGA